ncbi:MAG: hypothetical protein J3K34DRAFT_90680 [Monoraphidium minutum]|nr:MAG: hypothetical protein J3K34DRAFT_90680 [Monoraphidium minutum]
MAAAAAAGGAAAGGAAVARAHEELRNPDALTALLAGDTAALRSVTFGHEFGVTDEHVASLAAAVGRQLTSLRLGCADSGEGARLGDGAAASLAAGCGEGLETLHLTSVTGITGRGFEALMRGLPGLRELHFTGNDKITCKVSDRELGLLTSEPALLPHLTTLYLTDSSVGYAKVKQLCKKRAKLTVHHGTSDGESYAAGMVRSLMGAEWGDGLFTERGRAAQAAHDRAAGGGGKRRRGPRY